MSNLSDYIRNATIPPTSAILPASAYYTASSQFGAGGLDVSNLGLTKYDSPTTDQALAFQAAVPTGSCFFHYNGNALPTATVDIILSALRGDTQHGIQGGIQFGGIATGITIDLSGGTNGAPTPAQVHVDAIFTLQFSIGLTNTGSVLVNGGVFTITFDASTAFSASSISPGVSANIGTQDNPTATQIAAYLAGNDLGIGTLTFTALGDTATGTDTNEGNYGSQPGSIFDTSSSTGVTGNQTQVGEVFAPNADKAYIISQGGTVTTN